MTAQEQAAPPELDERRVHIAARNYREAAFAAQLLALPRSRWRYACDEQAMRGLSAKTARLVLYCAWYEHDRAARLEDFAKFAGLWEQRLYCDEHGNLR